MGFKDEKLWTTLKTKAEEEEVSDGIRVAFGWCCGDEPLPSTGEIKQAMHNPALAKKITNIRFR